MSSYRDSDAVLGIPVRKGGEDVKESTPGWFCQTCGEKAPPVSGREYPFHELTSVGELASRHEGVRA